MQRKSHKVTEGVEEYYGYDHVKYIFHHYP